MLKFIVWYECFGYSAHGVITFELRVDLMSWGRVASSKRLFFQVSFTLQLVIHTSTTMSIKLISMSVQVKLCELWGVCRDDNCFPLHYWLFKPDPLGFSIYESEPIA